MSLLGVLLLTSLTACGQEAGAEASSAGNPAPTVTHFCGVIEGFEKRGALVDGTPTFYLLLNDGRSILIEGMPEITITKGKFYVFTVGAGAFGRMPLVKTEATTVCGYESDSTSVDTTTAKP
jgi:hypothetical protein